MTNLSDDRSAAERVLTRMGIATVRDLQRVHGGADAGLWKVEAEQGIFALRLLAAGQERRARREAAIHEHLAKSEVLVPRIVAVGPEDLPPALLMEWAPGRTLGEILLDPRTGPGVRRALMHEFGALQAALHRAPPPVLPAAPEWIDRVSDPALLARLDAGDSGTDDRPPLVHLDFHPLNVLVHAGHVSAVLDWANATVADPRFDVARTRAILETLQDQGGTFAGTLRRAVDDWEEGYGNGADPGPDFRVWARAATARDLGLGRPRPR